MNAKIRSHVDLEAYQKAFEAAMQIFEISSYSRKRKRIR